MWIEAYNSQFLIVLKNKDDINKQVKIVTTAWKDNYHVIIEDLSLGAANAITCIMTLEQIEKEYGRQVHLTRPD